MHLSLNRVILFAANVNKLKLFYETAFNLTIVEEIPGTWVVFKTGSAELALHQAHGNYADESVFVEESNVKLVFETDTDIVTLRQQLTALGVDMGEIMYWDEHFLRCEGKDPEGNIFQLQVKR